MTVSPDPRVGARALIRHWLDNGVPSRTEFRELLQSLDAALEAALEREVPEVTMPDHDTCLGIGEMARDLMTGRIQYDGHIIEATLLWLEAEGKIRVVRKATEG